jgi:UDP-2-acetamido-2-deoxy-ribo-hexuluronate aminotransferase
MTTKTMDIKMVDTVGQYHRIRSEMDAAIQEVLETGAYINGPAVKRFTANFANYLGAKHVIPCANGTDALQIALMALDLKPGEEVITTPFTFFATAEVIALLGLIPVFVDIEAHTFNIDPAKIEAAITPKTRCIIPVHLFGLTSDMEPIMEVARKHNLYVIEDNAQAIGGDYTFRDGHQERTGLIGHIGSTSFYPSKNLGAYGDAGALYTNDSVLTEKMTMICNHGTRKKYYHERIGVNSRSHSIQAAVLDIKLRHLDGFVATRQEAASWYDELLGNVKGISLPGRPAYSTHVFHQYTVRILDGRARRDRLQALLTEQGIPTMIYYPVPLHIQQAAASYGYKNGDFPISEACSEQVISLPMHSELDRAQVEYIAQHFISCFEQSSIG